MESKEASGLADRPITFLPNDSNQNCDKKQLTGLMAYQIVCRGEESLLVRRFKAEVH